MTTTATMTTTSTTETAKETTSPEPPFTFQTICSDEEWEVNRWGDASKEVYRRDRRETGVPKPGFSFS
jgi:hypothetical protein